MICICIGVYGGFLTWWYLQIIHLSGMSLQKASILGYTATPILGNFHVYIYIYINITHLPGFESPTTWVYGRYDCVYRLWRPHCSPSLKYGFLTTYFFLWWVWVTLTQHGSGPKNRPMYSNDPEGCFMQFLSRLETGEVQASLRGQRLSIAVRPLRWGAILDRQPVPARPRAPAAAPCLRPSRILVATPAQPSSSMGPQRPPAAPVLASAAMLGYGNSRASMNVASASAPKSRCSSWRSSWCSSCCCLAWSSYCQGNNPLFMALIQVCEIL